MNIQTLSLIAGGTACNSRCPFCISQNTPKCGMDLYCPKLNLRNFKICLGMALRSNVSTVIITGKGEPTLFPGRIWEYLEHMSQWCKFPDVIPFIELQTNGIRLASEEMDEDLEGWKALGLTHINISVVHWEYEKNRAIYQPDGDYMDLPVLIAKLNQLGFTVRLSCMGVKGYIEDVGGLKGLLHFAKENGVKQITFRSIVRLAEHGEKNDDSISDVDRWVDEHGLEVAQINAIDKFVRDEGHLCLPLAHGANVFDIDGQNFCWATCLTTNTSKDDIRQIIFFQDGTIRYDWRYEGAILL